MPRIEIYKFGGTSVGSAQRIRAAADLVSQGRSHTRVVVVVSAMGGITDRLLEVSALAERRDEEAVRYCLNEIVSLHEGVWADLSLGVSFESSSLWPLAVELRALIAAVYATGEITLRVRDRIVTIGEKWSARLFAAALEKIEQHACVLDADTFLDTDDTFGEASPVVGAERTIVAAIAPILERGDVPVVTGFCGRSPSGETTALGRGGSDLSATVLAGALRADEVTIWTDVPGVLTADPRIVPEARSIGQLNYREAAELAYYGAKVLHQRTMIPIASLGIPVKTRSSLDPSHPGTVVDRRFTPGSHPIKGISAISGQCLLSVEGNGMAGVPGVSARMFGALAARRISVTLISQSSSESSICVAVLDADAEDAERALKAAFSPELSRGEIEEIVVQRGVGLVAAVGLGMAHTPGVAARVFGALGRQQINVLAIAQGSSELNISLALHSRDVPAAIRALHHALGLHRQDPGTETPDSLDIVILGCGRVGRALIGLLEERSERFETRFGLRPRIVGLADRSGWRFDPNGIDPVELAQIRSLKEQGGRIATWPGAKSTSQPAELITEAARWRLQRPVLIDVTDADHRGFQAAIAAGFDIVTANKVPLAGADSDYRVLMALVDEHARIFKSEATVGAGLPVLDTVEMLIETGDVIESIEGCFSGTLGYVMTRLRQGIPMSEAVREAQAAGYTEPDPAVDLSGVDIARKALILGRRSGMLTAGEHPVTVQGLCDPSLAGLPREIFFERLSTQDEHMARQVAEAAGRGEVLQFVARVQRGSITVGLRGVAATSPLGSLQGTDNLVVFTTERYRERPLVVQGPGAGVEVTAMGVLSDILRIAAERR